MMWQRDILPCGKILSCSCGIMIVLTRRGTKRFIDIVGNYLWWGWIHLKWKNYIVDYKWVLWRNVMKHIKLHKVEWLHRFYWNRHVSYPIFFLECFLVVLKKIFTNNKMYESRFYPYSRIKFGCHTRRGWYNIIEIVLVSWFNSRSNKNIYVVSQFLLQYQLGPYMFRHICLFIPYYSM